MDVSIFNCNLCLAYSTHEFASFKKHFVRFHKNDPNFSVACRIDSCAYTTNSWSSYKVHVHRKHKDIDTEPNDMIVEEEDEEDPPVLPFMREPDLRHFNSMFTLSLEAKHNVSQAGINNIVSTVENLVESHIKVYQKQIVRKMESVGMHPDVVNDIQINTSLEAFSSNAKRKAYYRKNLESWIEPQEVVVGKKYVTEKGKLHCLSRVGYIVPFKECLRQLLHLPEVWAHVQSPYVSQNEFMYDICDGDVLKNHPIFLEDKKALQVILNCDDMEIVNPLGSHVKKHKITMYYFTLANIPPEYRSKLHTIQLLAVCKTRDARSPDAERKILADFVNTIKEMETGGIEIDLHGEKHKIKGTLVIAPADTLASNWLGKFKEGVSFALKNCRRCEVENSKMKNVYIESQTVLRSKEKHIERCASLLELSKQAREYWSKLWGINGTSELLKIEGFDMISGLVQDPMHVLLEGVVAHQLAHTLYRFIYVQLYFDLKYLNTAILGFRYSYLHSEARPEPVEKKQIDGSGSIKQTASAMLTLVHTLPIIIGHKIPNGDAYWINTLRLIQIVIFCTSFYCTRDTAMYLQNLIAEYLYNFKSLHPKASFIPKMHYMVHLPSQMLMYGPLRHHWCMRFEGKNGYFSNKKYRNFKNVPLSLASRHQMYMAYMQTGYDGGRSTSFLYTGDTVPSGTEIIFADEYPELVEEFLQVANVHATTVYQVNHVTIHGNQYRKGCALVLDYDDDDIPTFAVILDIIVHDHVKYFILDVMESELNGHILCYAIQSIGKKTLLRHSSLTFKWPLSVYEYQGSSVVMNANSHTYINPF